MNKNKTTSTETELTSYQKGVVLEGKSGFFSRPKTHLLRGGAALRHRNYRLFFTGQLISLIGTWMQSLAQGWLVLKLTNNDPFALGTVSALQFLPVMLFSVFTGVVADRYPKRTIIILTQSSAMVLAFTLAILTTTGMVQVWEIYILATCLGLVNVFDMPARQSFVSEMVGKEDLINAVALNASIFNAARFLGPALAGLIIGLGETFLGSTFAGVALAFWLNGFSYIGVLTGLFRMGVSELLTLNRKTSSGQIFKNLKEGFAFIYRAKEIRSVILLVGMVGTFGYNFNIWIPVLARTNLKVGAEGFGLLMAALGLGSLIMALTLAVMNQRPTRERILFLLILFGLSEIGVAISGWFPLSLAFMFLTGLFSVAVSNSSNATIQLSTPDELRGRVMGVYMLVFAGTTPIGSIFVGWIASSFGTPFSMALGGTLSFITVPLFWLELKKRKQQPALTLEAASPSTPQDP